MAKLDSIGDAEIRSQLEQAHEQLRAGKHTDAVHTLSGAYLSMLAKRPEMLEESMEMRVGRRILAVMRWPALGANLSMESVTESRPRIEFTRDHFALSEAFTYYEFTVDTAIAHSF